jgi:tetratricopeptide (TPR) repeat protein/ADP-heptose:LPS heptosyltransferase
MEDMVKETVAKGVELHLAGELDLACQLYDAAIKLQPNHADANHNMGLLKLDKGHDLDALPYLQTALQANTSIAQFWLSYIKALVKLERRDEAAKIISLAKENGMESEEFLKLSQKLSTRDEIPTAIECQAEATKKPKSNILDTVKLDKALNLAKKKIKSGFSEEARLIYQDILDKFPKNKKAQQGFTTLNAQQTHNRIQIPAQETVNQLMNSYNQGDLVSVVEEAQTLIKQYPDAFMIWNILGAASKGLGKLEEALKAFQKATVLNPTHAESYNNLGSTFQDLGMLDEAIVAHKTSLSLKNDFAECYYNLGNALKDQKQLHDAEEAYQTVLLLKPNFIAAYNNMGIVLKEQGKLEEAVEAYRKAISINPNYAEAFNNMGFTLQAQRNFTEAINAFKKAIFINRNYAEAYYNMGRLYWLKHSFTKAFDLMEWRWQREQDDFNGMPLDSSKRKWNGESGDKVFVWKEQGIGDEIMFSSTFFELNQKSQKLIVECDKRLIPIYKRSFPGNIKFVDDRKKVGENEYNAQIAVGSLLKHFRSNISDFERASSGWLKADSKKTSVLRRKLKSHKNDKIIGISWFTRAKKVTSQLRNVPIDLFSNFLKKLPATYVNLQYGETTEELSQIRSKSGLEVKQIENLDLFNDLDGLAALISACDIVISIDNATVHLAGALGVDAKILLPFDAEERWGLNSNKSYWYDNVTLYRQDTLRDWNQPLENLVYDIKNMKFYSDHF